uniref:prostaglandin E2 receptor EP3 subtype-like n=1 Tax=Pristiophorus japonicus TaxID=55135 RepID=UPI00398EC159
MWDSNRSSSEQSSNMSSTSPSERKSMSILFPVIIMIIGTVGSTLALMLAYRSYHQMKNMRKKRFLLIIGAVAVTDLTSQLLISPIIIILYLTNRQWSSVDPSNTLCAFFGICMTIFGLCPLLLASAMAAEWTLAIHAPHCYSNYITIRLTKVVVVSTWVSVVIFALLPTVGFGRYTLQWPGTWCFINTGSQNLGNTIYVSIFTVLGIASLLITLSCNVATIRGLLVCSKNKISSTNKQWEKITLETLIQLMGIMCVAYVCWSPLLVLLLIKICTRSWSDHGYTSSDKPSSPNTGMQNDSSFLLIAIRLASFNQILEPWVYLLLRESLFRKVCQLVEAVTSRSVKGVNEITVTAEESGDLKEEIT